MYIVIVVVSIANKYLLQLSQCYCAIIYCSNPSLFVAMCPENIKIRKCIIRHQLGLDRPVSASSNSPLEGHPSRIRTFSLKYSIIFVILLLFILVTCLQPILFVFSQFLVNRFYFQLFQKFLHSFCGQRGCTRNCCIYCSILNVIMLLFTAAIHLCLQGCVLKI